MSTGTQSRHGVVLCGFTGQTVQTRARDLVSCKRAVLNGRAALRPTGEHLGGTACRLHESPTELFRTDGKTGKVVGGSGTGPVP